MTLKHLPFKSKSQVNWPKLVAWVICVATFWGGIGLCVWLDVQSDVTTPQVTPQAQKPMPGQFDDQ